MDAPHTPTTKPTKLAKRPRGGQRGNQNARKHGRYSALKPADRYAPLVKVLQSYGLKDPYAPPGLTIQELLEDPKTNLRLVFFMLQTTIELLRVRDRLSGS